MNRLALFVPVLEGGGAERVMLTLAQTFLDKGLEIDLILVNASHPNSVLPGQIPRRVNLIDLQARRTLTALPGLIQYLRKERPFGLISTITHANMIAVMAKQLARTNTHCMVINTTMLSIDAKYGQQWRHRLMPFLARILYRWADSVVTVSQGTRRDLQQITGLKNIHVIYNPIPVAEIQRLAAEPVVIPSETILAVGRLVPAKDFPTLIHAFKKLLTYQQAHLLILGEGPERPMLENLINEIGLKNSVIMPGFVENPYAYMKRAKLLVMSSRYEGFPNVLLEAMACGCPVISTDCESGPAEILDSGRYGTMVRVGDVDALANAMFDTLENPIDSTILIQRATAFSPELIADRYLSLIRGNF